MGAAVRMIIVSNGVKISLGSGKTAQITHKKMDDMLDKMDDMLDILDK